MDLGYARVSTAEQDLDRQVGALRRAGIPSERICLDRRSGATTDRPGLSAAHARAVATAKGRRVGRSSVVDPDELAHAVHLREAGHTIAEMVTRTGITPTSLYRHLPPTPAVQLTEAPVTEAR